MESVTFFPSIMTESELIEYLRIPQVSKASDHRNVVANLKRSQGLPCIHISNNCLYPRAAVDAWVQKQAGKDDRI